ncbi:uncharacterized protein LODBEIA_P36180 [Lodderomyces beijingensis]|uniref:BZIP domain-containing protein n=1 Tax=Lodderomyces beijingensis TaxID=1775926 RepID=A0ABP0ZNA9_9ASCO
MSSKKAAINSNAKKHKQKLAAHAELSQRLSKLHQQKKQLASTLSERKAEKSKRTKELESLRETNTKLQNTIYLSLFEFISSPQFERCFPILEFQSAILLGCIELMNSGRLSGDVRSEPGVPVRLKNEEHGENSNMVMTIRDGEMRSILTRANDWIRKWEAEGKASIR